MVGQRAELVVQRQTGTQFRARVALSASVFASRSSPAAMPS